MQFRQWIKQAESNGWALKGVSGLQLTLRCSKQGCTGGINVPLQNLGPVPPPCDLPHAGQYSAKTFETYKALVGELVRRRRSLGLSQEDICAASGLADGHINKLEAFARTAQLPTLQLWAETLGLKMAFVPAPMPDATLKAIERRPAPLRETKPHARITHVR